MATTPNTMTMMVNNPALADSLEQLAEAYESAANIARAQAESLRQGFPVAVDITLTPRSNVMEGSPTPTTIPTHNHEPGEPVKDGYCPACVMPASDPFSFMTPDTTTTADNDDNDGLVF